MNASIRPKAIKSVLFAVIAITVLIVFNTTRRPPTSDAQYRYGHWLATLEMSLRPGTTPPPPVTVSLATAGDGLGSQHWEIRTGTGSAPDTGPQARDQMYRILQLVQESGVLGTSSVAADDTTTPRYVIKIDNLENHFSIAVPASYVAGNIQAQNLVKLIQLYAATVTTPVSVPGQL